MKRLICIMLAGLLCTACADDIQEEVTVGRISGVVSDKNTGEPVATVSAVLSPGGNSTVTGSDGSFEFVDLAPGEYTVNINKEGYKGNNKTVTVVAGQTTQAHLLIERIPAVITANRTELDFGKDYSVNTLSFNIVNNNYEKLSWEMVNNCGWITDVSPKSGSLDYGKTGTIIVKIDRDLLADGNNTTVLVLSTEGVGSTEITVKAYGQAKKKAVLNTLKVSSITATTAVLTGEIIEDGYPKYYERGIVFSEQMMPTVEQTLQRLTATMTADSIYSCQAVGLTLGKTYYVRAYAVNEVGTAYSSNQISFTTKEPDYIVIDDLGIAVQREDIGCGSYSSMKTLCEGSKMGGFTDWRLPTISELSALYKLRDKIGGFKTSGTYWASTFYGEVSYNSCYYTVSFDNGKQSWSSKSNNLNARAVRTLTE